MKIEVTQCSMCTHYNTEQFCEVWKQYISNDAFYCACGVKADRKTEPIIYGNEHNCMMTVFGECSYAETGCGDCAVVEKVRNALDKYEPKDEPQTERSE